VVIAPRLTTDLAEALLTGDPAPASLVDAGRDAWGHRGMELEILEVVFDSDEMISLDGGRATRLLAFAGPLTVLAVHVERDPEASVLTGFLEDVDGIELAESGPDSPPRVLGSLVGHRVESWLRRKGPVRFWLRAPGQEWRSATEWVLLPG
jgi:hypothetical protein